MSRIWVAQNLMLKIMKDEEILEKYGWIIECESPLEISMESDATSRATGWAAEIVIDHLREHGEDYEEIS